MFEELFVLFHTTVWLIRKDIRDVSLIMQHRDNEPASEKCTQYVDKLTELQYNKNRKQDASQRGSSTGSSHNSMQLWFRFFFY